MCNNNNHKEKSFCTPLSPPPLPNTALMASIVYRLFLFTGVNADLLLICSMDHGMLTA